MRGMIWEIGGIRGTNQGERVAIPVPGVLHSAMKACTLRFVFHPRANVGVT
jgi:hypothetical protein